MSTQSITAILSDGRRIVADGIDPMYGTGFEDRLAGLFRTLVQAGDVTIVPVADEALVTDRHGREPALLILPRGEAVQLPLLRAGLTRFTGFSGDVNGDLRDVLLQAESEARSAERGLWSDSRFKVFTPETAPQRDGFTLVEGVPLAVARTRSMVYLNFGEDWRTDFTAAIEPRLLKNDAWDGWDLEALVGRTLRLRGWMRRYNGAFMTLTSPDQIEILDE
ncbi:MAG: thermonuclease family protein [Alphaproteobacteria bacterium]